MTFSFITFVFVFFPFEDVYAINFPICTVVIYVMIFVCPFLHCRALRTAMYTRYVNSIIISIIIIKENKMNHS